MNLAVERTTIGQDRRNPAQTLIALVRRQLVLLSALLCAIVLFNIATNAQLTTADIIGTVYDSSGAVLPNAKVTLMNQGTHETRSAQSGNGGEYSFAFLLPGSYSVRVEAQGFTTFTPREPPAAPAAAASQTAARGSSNSRHLVLKRSLPRR